MRGPCATLARESPRDSPVRESLQFLVKQKTIICPLSGLKAQRFYSAEAGPRV
jgi:hypothetical protein